LLSPLCQSSIRPISSIQIVRRVFVARHSDF
jgi:hypothetical protein